MDDGAGALPSYFSIVSKGDCAMRQTLAVLAAAALLSGTIATGAEARGGHMGGFHHVAGRFGGPIIGGAAPMAPIYNSSGGYTVAPSIEAPVSPASPGSVFH
jgi:hypothetical protein